VRNLVGAAPAHVLEEVMQAVARGASENVLRQVDQLISEGHSPTHFARQMVRFLRNATVAKIAGKDSSLLQISSEERERVERVAALFGEEDLTRHLQIMLRTHGELGYKQEQRFHLELGLLKMAHAQRLLPIEQLLSDVAGAANTFSNTPSDSGRAGVPRTSAKPSIVPSPLSGAIDTRRADHVSPFAADSARKGGPRQESAADQVTATAPRGIAGGSAPPRVVMGSTAPANINEIEAEPRISSRPEPQRQAEVNLQPASQAQVEPQVSKAQPSIATAGAPIDRLKSAVLQALTDGNQRILVSMLEAGEWTVEGNEFVIKVSESQTVVDMSVGSEARRLAIASASGILGRAVKLKIVAGATVAAAEKRDGASAKSGGATAGVGGRGRAEQDAVVRRLQEKFGAEIRTVIDYKEKR
jgi:DNA polymerase-3 subunit gamma/tau